MVSPSYTQTQTFFFVHRVIDQLCLLVELWDRHVCNISSIGIYSPRSEIAEMNKNEGLPATSH